MEPLNQSSKSQKGLNNRHFQFGLTRRELLGGCLGCAAFGIGLSALGVRTAIAQTKKDYEKAKVCLVFTHKPPTTKSWPNVGYDYEGRKKQLLRQLQNECPGIEFITVTADNVKDAKKILESNSDVDGFIVYMVGIWTRAPQVIAGSGKPTIFVDDLYGGSGEFLVAYAAAKRKKLKVAGVSSSDFNDVVQAARCFECLGKLKSSVILLVGRGWGCKPETIESELGTKVIRVPFEEIDGLYKKADKQKAKEFADRWIRNAQKVVEPSREEIEKSGAMYLAMKELMEKHNAEAITIDCLAGFYGGKISAYPCLGFCQLNNDGYVGACESDLRSTITMLVMTYLVGRPGYISDPVIDTSKNQIIYAHCVAPTKVFGPEGTRNPYHIRDHSEDRKGAAIRSILPLGEVITNLEFDTNKRKVVLHMAKTEANIDEDKACRTKLAAKVTGDIDKLMGYWDEWGWHRVTVYGDYKRAVENMAALLGYEVIEEA
ncbi:MAG: hypothetical protein ACYSSI_07910 [Planctomycetota bacterium]|jgi:hypothetical protein